MGKVQLILLTALFGMFTLVDWQIHDNVTGVCIGSIIAFWLIGGGIWLVNQIPSGDNA